jgi:hypothetical protein
MKNQWEIRRLEDDVKSYVPPKVNKNRKDFNGSGNIITWN